MHTTKTSNVVLRSQSQIITIRSTSVNVRYNTLTLLCMTAWFEHSQFGSNLPENAYDKNIKRCTEAPVIWSQYEVTSLKQNVCDKTASGATNETTAYCTLWRLRGQVPHCINEAAAGCLHAPGTCCYIKAGELYILTVLLS